MDRLEKDFKKVFSNVLEDFVGMPNTSSTRRLFRKDIIDEVKKEIINKSKVKKITKVICDETNNPIEVVRANKISVDISGFDNNNKEFIINLS